MIKQALALAVLAVVPAVHAEIFEDYTPSTEVTELTIVTVQPNYVDDYLMNLKTTWVPATETMKEMGMVTSYGIWVTQNNDTPNVYMTVTYKDLGAMQMNAEQYEELMETLEDKYEADEEENEKTAKSYEEYRTIVDRKNLVKITYK